jgi:hypothetical protein
MINAHEASLMLFPAIMIALTVLSICYLEYLRRRERDDRLVVLDKYYKLCRLLIAERAPPEQRKHVYEVTRYWTPEVLEAAVTGEQT